MVVVVERVAEELVDLDTVVRKYPSAAARHCITISPLAALVARVTL
jgi:hypothetical protein